MKTMLTVIALFVLTGVATLSSCTKEDSLAPAASDPVTGNSNAQIQAVPVSDPAGYYHEPGMVEAQRVHPLWFGSDSMQLNPDCLLPIISPGTVLAKTINR